MKGFQLTFFTQQNHKHKHLSLGEWLIQEARKLGIGGATLTHADEGFGHHGRIHATRFFELADQPVEVTMAVSQTEADLIFNRLREEGIKIFYVKVPIEYGTTMD